MSILSIGQKNIGNYRSPFFSLSQDEMERVRKENKINQQQYRLELFQQMKQKWNAKKSEPFTNVSKYQHRRMRTQQPTNDRYSYANRQLPAIQQSKSNPFSFPSFSLWKQQSNSSEVDSQPIRQRMKTEAYNSQYSGYRSSKPQQNQLRFQDRPQKRYLNALEDLEMRRKQINRYDDQNVDQFYDKMLNSIQSLRKENQDRQMRKYSINPTKINSRKNFLQKASAFLNPQQQKLAPRKLPSLLNQGLSSPNYIQSSAQKNWREWYAQQKLRELDSYYKKVTVNQQIKNRYKSKPYPYL